MSNWESAQKNQTTKITPSVSWRIKSVQLMDSYRIRVRFNDGLEGVVDLSKRVSSAHATVFSALKDPAIFNQVHVKYGAVTWPGEIDLAPDAMYQAIKEKGEWVLG